MYVYVYIYIYMEERFMVKSLGSRVWGLEIRLRSYVCLPEDHLAEGSDPGGAVWEPQAVVSLTFKRRVLLG